MPSKVILAACGGVKSYDTLVCRAAVTVGELTEDGITKRGYESGLLGGSFGAYATIEGDVACLSLFDVPANLGSGNNATHMAVMPVFDSNVLLVNETTGVSFSTRNLLNGGDWCMFASYTDLLFSGIEAGQECIIAIYK